MKRLLCYIGLHSLYYDRGTWRCRCCSYARWTPEADKCCRWETPVVIRKKQVSFDYPSMYVDVLQCPKCGKIQEDWCGYGRIE